MIKRSSLFSVCHVAVGWMASLPFHRAVVFVISFYIPLFTKLGSANLNVFRVGQVTGNRGTFLAFLAKNGWQNVAAMFCFPWATGCIRNEINYLADVIQRKSGRVILTHCIYWYHTEWGRSSSTLLKAFLAGNIFQNGVVVKPVLHHAKNLWMWILGLREKVPSNDCKQRLKYGF